MPNVRRHTCPLAATHCRPVSVGDRRATHYWIKAPDAVAMPQRSSPCPDGIVPTARRQGRAVRAEGDRRDTRRVPVEGVHQLATLHTPEFTTL